MKLKQQNANNLWWLDRLNPNMATNQRKPRRIFPQIIILLLCIIFPVTGLAQQPDKDTAALFIPGEVLVKFRPDVLGTADVLRVHQVEVAEISPQSGLIRTKVTPGQESAVIAALQARNDVEYATYNYTIQATIMPNDPHYQSNLQWGLAKINAPQAWDIHTGSSAITIAVIDTGVDLDHPDLQAKVVPGYDFYNDDDNPDDDSFNSHGTHVAGIAAASSNNLVGVAGLSWGARIMPLKVLSSSGGGSSFDLADAVLYAVDNGAQVINMSIGGRNTAWPCTWPHIESAFDYALAHDVILVVASGNDGQNGVNCPGAYDQALAVGSTTTSDTRSSFSNYGPRLDVMAPGSDILSTKKSNNYGYLSGTSMATPYVSGLAALLRGFDASLTAAQTRQVIESATIDLGSPGWDPSFGHGRIDAALALSAVQNFNTSPAQTSFQVDSTSGPFPPNQIIQITTNDTEIISWTTIISPAVSWLNVTSPESGTISAAASPLEVSLAATRPAAFGVYSTTVTVTGSNNHGVSVPRDTVVTLRYVPKLTAIYLPIIGNNGSLAPDLVIDSLTVQPNDVTVVIKNQGSTPVVDAFWVDLYLNPDSPPTAVNQTWQTQGSQGIAWGITALPLHPGQSVTLTLANHVAEESNFSLPFDVGLPVWGQVDAVNVNTTYGGVLEDHEVSGSSYNNISGPVSVGGAVIGGSGLTNETYQPAREHALPAR